MYILHAGPEEKMLDKELITFRDVRINARRATSSAMHSSMLSTTVGVHYPYHITGHDSSTMASTFDPEHGKIPI